MFPIATKIIGSREELIQSYVDQVNSLETTDFAPKPTNSFRFCSYNVKFFKFKNYTSADVKLFIDKINPDAFSLIEYDNKYDNDFKYNNNNSNHILFEQLPGYGILTAYNTFDVNKGNYSLQCLDKVGTLDNERQGKLNELKGFTHMSIKHNEITINIFTIHLDVCDESGNTRLQEIKDLYEYIIKKTFKNVIILGDFNEWYLKKTDATYDDSLLDFKQRTGLDHFSTKTHDFLFQHNFTNVFHLKNKSPKFSCWSGKLVDFCYLFKDSWNSSVEIKDIYMPFIPYSDHLPIIIDILSS